MTDPRSTKLDPRSHGSHMLVSKIKPSTRPRPSTGINPGDAWVDRDGSTRCMDRSTRPRPSTTIDPARSARPRPRPGPIPHDRGSTHDRSPRPRPPTMTDPCSTKDRSTIDHARPHGSHMLVSKIKPSSTRSRPSTGIDPGDAWVMHGSARRMDPHGAWIDPHDRRSSTTIDHEARLEFQR